MPYVSCVPNCRENYPTGPKVNVFGFLQDESLRKNGSMLLEEKILFRPRQAK